MPAIRILPDRVANQIAAGEVIERPVAVIKELVENSIDAEANRIEVEFRNGGKAYMRVSDNGKGMHPDEALLALERHATSKIREAGDLNHIFSFGFRGEALPSIASVSKFTLRTRAQGNEFGVEIVINGGKLLSKKECGMPVGTVIEVAHLFNSVPARRKFLKTDPTESAHITYTCRLFAVAHPQLAFRVLENGRNVFNSPACPQLQARIGEIWGRSLADDLIPVTAEDTQLGLKLRGLTAKPGIGRSTRRELVTLVNRRPVDSRLFSYAVFDAYHGRIQKGRYPPAFLFLSMPSDAVDVNVHPAKREVRFRHEANIRRFILSAINSHLNDFSAQSVADLHSSTPAKPAVERAPTVQVAAKPSASPPPAHVQEVPSVAPAPKSKPKSIPKASSAGRPQATPAPQPTVTPSPISQAKKSAQVNSKPLPSAEPVDIGWEFIHCFQKRYALYATPRGLVMIYLRHADQRIQFELIGQNYNERTVAAQQLLVPHPMELDPLNATLLEQNQELFQRQGFDIEAFGRNFYRLSAIPDWLSEAQAEQFVRDLIDQLRISGTVKASQLPSWQIVAKLAVQTSYRRNQTLSTEALKRLPNQLFRCDLPHSSPFGKPTFSEIDWAEWERRLGIKAERESTR
jgi:DNA mismatch repair protein MutL